MPDPCRDWTTPIAASAWRPARTDGRLTPIWTREVALGRQPVAGTQAPAIDQGADESDDLFGAALDAPAFPGVPAVPFGAMVITGRTNYRRRDHLRNPRAEGQGPRQGAGWGVRENLPSPMPQPRW